MTTVTMTGIKIVKQTIEVDVPTFIIALKELAALYKEMHPKQFVFTKKILNAEFGMKLTDGNFYQLAKDCKLQISYNGFLLDDILNLK